MKMGIMGERRKKNEQSTFFVESYMRQADQAYMDSTSIWISSLVNHAFSRWYDDYQWLISDLDAYSALERSRSISCHIKVGYRFRPDPRWPPVHDDQAAFHRDNLNEEPDN
jgi:hypothetical protein